jgi:hypothetical protein
MSTLDRYTHLIGHGVLEQVFAKRLQVVVLLFAEEDHRSRVPVERVRVEEARIGHRLDVVPEKGPFQTRVTRSQSYNRELQCLRFKNFEGSFLE